MFLVSESGHEHILAFKILLSCVIQNIICSPFWKKRQMRIKFRTVSNITERKWEFHGHWT